MKKLLILFYLSFFGIIWAGNVSVTGDLQVVSNEIILNVQNIGNEPVHFRKVVFYYGGHFVTNEISGNIAVGQHTGFKLIIIPPVISGSYPIAALFVYENDNKPVSLVVSDYLNHGSPSTLNLNPSIQTPVIHRKGKIILSLPKKASLPRFDILFPTELKVERVTTNGNQIIYWVRNMSYPLKIHTRVAFLFYNQTGMTVSGLSKMVPLVLQASSRSPFSVLLFWTLAVLISLAVFALLLVSGMRKYHDGQKEQAWKQVYLAVVFLLGFFSYFFQYNLPSGAFWDENYHMASAQKYINGVFFMEPHPPLGKLIIALGEVVFQPNRGLDTSGFLRTDHIDHFPAGYSFEGMRFFPTLMAWLSVILFYLILIRVLKKPRYAFLFSSIYLFENGLIGHSRSAMLEGVQLFFIFAVILYFIRLWQEEREKTVGEYFILAVFVGLASAVKLNGLILTLLFVFLAIAEYWKKLIPEKIQEFRLDKIEFGLKELKTLALKTVVSVFGVVLIIGGSYYIHIARCTRIESGRVYQASASYQQILKTGNPANPLLFPKLLGEHIAFIHHYEKGVPKWDPSKIEENGSPAFTWPFGYKTINYRWAKARGRVAYKYLVGNPYIWTLSLLTLVLTLIILGHAFLFGEDRKHSKLFELMAVFFAMYVAYMWVMLGIDRVMYLYHYFVPLVFSFILIPVVYRYLFDSLIDREDPVLWWATVALVVQIFLVYLYFAPFTYFLPLSAQEFMRRVWSNIWHLTPVY